MKTNKKRILFAGLAAMVLMASPVLADHASDQQQLNSVEILLEQGTINQEMQVTLTALKESDNAVIRKRAQQLQEAYDKLSLNDSCPACSFELNDADYQGFVVLDCGHMCHRECLIDVQTRGEWGSQDRCPECRKYFTEADKNLIASRHGDAHAQAQAIFQRYANELPLDRATRGQELSNTNNGNGASTTTTTTINNAAILREEREQQELEAERLRLEQQAREEREQRERVLREQEEEQAAQLDAAQAEQAEEVFARISNQIDELDRAFGELVETGAGDNPSEFAEALMLWTPQYEDMRDSIAQNIELTATHQATLGERINEQLEVIGQLVAESFSAGADANAQAEDAQVQLIELLTAIDEAEQELEKIAECTMSQQDALNALNDLNADFTEMITQLTSMDRTTAVELETRIDNNLQRIAQVQDMIQSSSSGSSSRETDNNQVVPNNEEETAAQRQKRERREKMLAAAEARKNQEQQ